MIEFVRIERRFDLQAPPQRFKTDAPVAAQAVGLAAACDYPTRLGMPRVSTHERALTQILLASLAKRPWVRVIGPVDCQDHSDVVDGVRAHDVGQILDDAGVAVRVDHHCAWPLHQRMTVTTTRASFAALFNALDQVPAVFGMAA